MKKLTLTKITKRINVMIHPYRKSHHAQVYEEIADLCGSTPDRAYRIAHGAHIQSFADSATLTELKRRNIVLG